MNVPVFLSITAAIAFLLFSSQDACYSSNERRLRKRQKYEEYQTFDSPNPNNIPKDQKKHYIKEPSSSVRKKFEEYQAPRQEAEADDGTQCKEVVNAKFVYILAESGNTHECDASFVAVPTGAEHSRVLTTRASCLGVREIENKLYLPDTTHMNVKLLVRGDNEQRNVIGVLPYPSLAVEDDFAIVMLDKRENVAQDGIQPGCVDSRYRAWAQKWVAKPYPQSAWAYDPKWLYKFRLN